MNRIQAEQFTKHIIVPTLEHLDMLSDSAIVLLLGTASIESGFTYLHQIGGIAKGYFQMEPNTHDDIWDNYLAYRPHIAGKLTPLLNEAMPKVEQLAGNMYYACAMARIHYLRVPEKLPKANDAYALAEYYKKHYNTVLGASTVQKSIPHFEAAYDLL